MAALQTRAYSAAHLLWSAITQCIAIADDSPLDASAGKRHSDALMPFVFPPGSRPDDSPLFVLCYNDTCSFTWTGDEHINQVGGVGITRVIDALQDIFECRTCGLTGSLCCCSECAFVCHRNHDCKCVLRIFDSLQSRALSFLCAD